VLFFLNSERKLILLRMGVIAIEVPYDFEPPQHDIDDSKSENSLSMRPLPADSDILNFQRPCLRKHIHHTPLADRYIFLTQQRQAAQESL
jgi:hypothetical protein